MINAIRNITIEFGVEAVTNSQEMFAKLCLDAQQAEFSWITTLEKQANYEEAFFNFDPLKIATLTENEVERLMQNAGIVRNRLKIQSIIKNAKAYSRIESTGISFSDYIWQFVDDKTIINFWVTQNDVLTSTIQSDKMAKYFKKQGDFCRHNYLLRFYASSRYAQRPYYRLFLL
jgi:DNA-3-methyladenine glycosylase I